MINLIHADLYKMRKSTIMKVLLLITIGTMAAMMIIASLLTSGKLNAAAANIGFLFSDVNIISLIGALAAAVLICGDFDNKTIHEAITCGHSRLTIVLGKISVFFIAILILLSPYIIAAATYLLTSGQALNMGTVAVGYLHMMTENTASASLLISKQLGVILTLALVYIAQLSICLPLAFALKKPMLIVPVYYAITLIGAQLLTLSQTNQTVDKFFSLTPFGGDHTLLTAASAPGIIIKAIIVSLSFILLMLLITMQIFRRMEIK